MPAGWAAGAEQVSATYRLEKKIGEKLAFLAELDKKAEKNNLAVQRVIPVDHAADRQSAVTALLLPQSLCRIAGITAKMTPPAPVTHGENRFCNHFQIHPGLT